MTVNLTWTATTSAFADGYEIDRASQSGGPYSPVGTVSGQSTTNYTDTTAGFSTTYYYVVRATKASWRSVDSGEASVTTLSTACT